MDEDASPIPRTPADPSCDVDLSLVIPAYNEGRGLDSVLRKAIEVLGTLPVSFEIVVVDDGSTDDTTDVLAQVAKDEPRLRIIALRANVGQHIATFVGLTATRGRMVVISDADESVPLENIKVLYEAAEANPAAEVVSGARSRRNAAWYRDAGSRLVTLLVNRLTKTRLSDPATTFRLFRRPAIREILRTDILAQNLPLLVGYLRLRVTEVPISTRRDGGRSSRYDVIRLVHILLLALLNFSAGTTTILFLMCLGSLSALVGMLGLTGIVAYGMVAAVPLPTNWLLFFVLLLIVGLQFVLVGTVAYKVERINVNLRFRRQLQWVRHARDD